MSKLEDKKAPNGVVYHMTEHLYKDRKIIIASRKNSGMKAHIFFPGSDKVECTLRFNFIDPAKLLQKAINKIEKLNQVDL